MLTRFSEIIEWLRLKKTPVILSEEEEEDEEDQNWQKRRRAHERDAEKRQRQQDRQEDEHGRPERKPRRFFRRSDLVVSVLLSVLFVLGLATSARVVGLGGNAVASAAPPTGFQCKDLSTVLNNNGFTATLGNDGTVNVHGDPPDYKPGSNSVHPITLSTFVKWLPTTATPTDQYVTSEDALLYNQDPAKGDQVCYLPGDRVHSEILRQLDMAFTTKNPPGSVYCKYWGTTGGDGTIIAKDYYDDLRDFFDHIDKALATGWYPAASHPDNTLLGTPPDFTKIDMNAISGDKNQEYTIDTDMLQQAADIDGMDYRANGQFERTICVPGNWQSGEKFGGSKFSQQAVLTWLTKVYHNKQQQSDVATNIATSVLNTFVKAIGDMITTSWKTLLDWGANLLFPYVTPANMTYGLDAGDASHHRYVIDEGHQLVLAIVGSLASLALVIGAYRLLGRRYLGESGTELLDTLGQVCIGLVAATFCWPLLSMLIDKESELTRSVTLFLLQKTIGDKDWVNNIFTMGGGIADYTAGGGQGLGMLLALVVEVIIAILLMLQNLTRIALLDLLLIFSPLWIFCLFFKPWRKIGSVGLGMFGVTLLMQPVQVISLDMGQILLLQLPSLSGPLPPLITVVLAAMFYYVAFRIPGMLYQLFAGTSFAGFMVTNKGLQQGTRSAIQGFRHPIKTIIG